MATLLQKFLTDDRLKEFARLSAGIAKNWTPHEAQAKVGEAIFLDGARRIFIECGRKWGKTEFAVDLCWRLGNMIQSGQIYYFGAYQKAVREFLWAPGRLQNHGPKEFIQDIHKTEMRQTFTSNTFVKLDGADEFKVSKGFNPDVVILDEYADYPEDFWIAMSPNFASKDTIVIIISSPPWQLESEPGSPVHFIRLADLWKKYMNEAVKLGKKSKYMYVNMPTSANPYINAEWLEQEKKDLTEMGLPEVYDREYDAKRVIGGGKRIVGTFDRTKHVHPHEWIMEHKIRGREDQLLWATVADPGTTSVFAGLVMAIDEFSKEVYFLDEQYVKDQMDETTEHIIWPQLEEKENEVYPLELNNDSERFGRVYDEAASWWAAGCLGEFGVTWHPTEKAKNSREFGITLLRSVFRYNKAFVSDRCGWFIWELENWRKDKNGNVPKINDHCIDCARYGLHYLEYVICPEDKDKVPILTPRQERHAHAQGTVEAELEEMINELYQDRNAFSSQAILAQMEEAWNPYHLPYQ